MISVQQADHFIHSHLFTPKIETVDIHDCVGRILAESITADRPFPPFDRVSMDGIAIRFVNYENGQRKFKKSGIAAAGSPQQVVANPSDCIEVMTGAILPTGVDTVIRYEDIDEDQEGHATITIEDLSHKKNVHEEGSDRKQGDELLKKGTRLRASEIGVLASVGRNKVQVWSQPNVVIITTGDELVDISEIPKNYQIRKSNNVQIAAMIKPLVASIDHLHLPDQKEMTENTIASSLEKYDVLVMSGGVSKGKFDYVPGALEKNGVKKLFHKVAQRPGKPFWFGRHDNGATVFALPGNPVSSFMCCRRYLMPWIQHSLSGQLPPKNYAILSADFHFEPNLTYFLQVQSYEGKDGGRWAAPIPGGGSGDLANLSDVDGFLELPSERNSFRKEEVFIYHAF